MREPPPDWFGKKPGCAACEVLYWWLVIIGAAGALFGLYHAIGG